VAKQHFFFRSDILSAPACLPAGEFFPDVPTPEYENKIGIIVGLGHQWDPNQACQTTFGGPAPFHNCKFPFYEYTEAEVKPVNHACSLSTTTPSSIVPICKEFNEQVSDF
jgi:hypothetical protein